MAFMGAQSAIYNRGVGESTLVKANDNEVRFVFPNSFKRRRLPGGSHARLRSDTDNPLHCGLFRHVATRGESSTCR